MNVIMKEEGKASFLYQNEWGGDVQRLYIYNFYIYEWMKRFSTASIMDDKIR